MALPYKKWTEQDILDRNVSPEGDYKFLVIDAVMKKTKPAYDKDGKAKIIHDMLELNLEFSDANGVLKKQKDWIVFIEGMDWKLRHLASATGTLNFYDNDELDCHHLKGKRGSFTLGIRDGEYNGEKRKQNFVKDYIKKDVSLSDVNAVKHKDLNDDIPF